MTATGLRVPVVDDDEDSRRVLSLLLAQAGYDVYGNKYARWANSELSA